MPIQGAKVQSLTEDEKDEIQSKFAASESTMRRALGISGKLKHAADIRPDPLSSLRTAQGRQPAPRK